jgi:CRP-like cAMP-binding protein
MGSVMDAMVNNTSLGPIGPSVKTVSFKKGDIILHSYQSTDYLHVVRSGLVKVYTINNKGDEVIGVVYGKGDMFPLAWVMLNRHKDAFFQAMTDCEIALLPKQEFSRQMETSAEVSHEVSKRILEQFELYASHVTNLSFRFGRERLAYRLLLLGARVGEEVNGTIVLPRISQQDLAATIHTTRESLNREMTRFTRLNIVTSAPGKIVILDPAALRREVGEDVPVLFFDPDR